MNAVVPAVKSPPGPVLVVGAGTMGAGIAQVAALAGHPVWLHDTRAGAAAEAIAGVGRALQAEVAKGRLAADTAAQTLARLRPVATLDEAAGATLVVEAIVERLDAKRALFEALEAWVSDDAVLATNTSSISVTAIGHGLRRPQRLVGMHFFNPVPRMRLVEVVSGLQTAPAVAQTVEALARAWGKTPVHARATPGFIVNRIARPYYAEALALLQEGAATPARIDACLRGAGFRMGPCALMDLIGHDTNFAVTQSVYEAFCFDKRFMPSPLQREMVEGGLLGRKRGRGFYTYDVEGQPLDDQDPEATPGDGPAPPPAAALTLFGSGPVAEALAARLAARGLHAERRPGDGVGLRWQRADGGLGCLQVTDGRSATEIAAQPVAEAGAAAPQVAVFDLPLFAADGAALAWAPAWQSAPGWATEAAAWLRALGFSPREMADAPGLVVARTLAMLINEAADAVQHGVCTPQGADAAMTLGVNYPAGPFAWLQAWSAPAVVALLDALDAHHRGERYRASPWLRLRALAGTL